jgi:CheY-like chemotaxis protein
MSASTIVSVEDSDTDFMALQHALKAVGVNNPIERCENGRKAAGCLLSDAVALSERASLIMLDLNLPGIDGRDLLRKMRAQDPERAVPIIVLSTSSHPKDIDSCYRAGADAYMVKPLELEDWETKVGQLAQSWLKSGDQARTCKLAVARNGADVASERLSRVIEGEIIPRLLLAHGSSEAISGDHRPVMQVGEEEVGELTRLLLSEDFTVASLYVASIHAQGVSVGSLYISLLAPTAWRIGDWWHADRCDFTEVSLALSRLQRLMRDFAPFEGPTKH